MRVPSSILGLGFFPFKIRAKNMRLGVYMQTAGARLKAKEPANTKDIAYAIRSSEKYANETMERLVRFGIALQVIQDENVGWVRGNNWQEAASRYGWSEIGSTAFSLT